MDYNILIGGAAGQGVDTIANILEKGLKRAGYFVFSTKDYMSRIRGGHNFSLVRFSDKPLCSQKDSVDIIIALNDETVALHQNKLNIGGKILIDSASTWEGEYTLALPIMEEAKKLGNPKVMGTIFVGIVFKLFSLPISEVENYLTELFQGKILETNQRALEIGYGLTEPKFVLAKPHDLSEYILINGNESIALGALAADCSFYSAYPMTPSTSIMTYLAKKQKDGVIVVEQAEDEIAAVLMALGASYTGVRAMTGTSGGGFSLMVESIGLAGITEVPLVVAEVQRPGPATGLPTRTEQSDLKFVINCSQGEFPLMVISLNDVQDAFYQTARAFNLAEKYQIPVILLSDQYLADYNQTVKAFDLSKITIDRGLAGEEAFVDGEYKRYTLTETGISPRIIPGKYPNQVVLVDSDEHDEYGKITESAEVRKMMVDKRMKKLEVLKEELEEPKKIGLDRGEILLLAWGSTYGPLKEATEMLLEEGYNVTTLVFGDLWPLPQKTLKELAPYAKRIINIEGNATGQLKDLVREQTGVNCHQSILKYDGRPFSSEELHQRIKEVLK
ncbi:2-oxoacid:acceptor oxidoreductase subunit alpha [Anaerobranca gottschalkii]|uniref:2-oxoglutarate ferredoxin oxidoreductase subunit alpha n=1 Tax=Anaerobranca gottschalkii DSM 13577 TaxID=1120990 RepID=A0A1I0CP75_9FIRM|nr:2-oxoacid:acceptor oxidoreductase subunit alpha [Anaerobranca gottschalkii]SET21399.1 2-oxoglutarate ferredoxin oxidoreductase subunit alpha [Anaerobranca gottschalkii DSM 13577]